MLDVFKVAILAVMVVIVSLLDMFEVLKLDVSMEGMIRLGAYIVP